MKYVIAAVVLAAMMGAANAQVRSIEDQFLLCPDVSVAARVHQMVTADKSVWRAVGSKALDEWGCVIYRGSNRWKLMDTNRTVGYAKVLYDVNTKNPKVGYMPFFFAWGMGLAQ